MRDVTGYKSAMLGRQHEQALQDAGDRCDRIYVLGSTRRDAGCAGASRAWNG